MKSGDTIFYRVGLPVGPQLDRESWQPVVEANHYWYATFLGGQPAVFSARPSQQNADIIGLQLTDHRWRSFFSYDQSLPGNLGVFWNEASNSFFILMESFPGALKLLEFNGSELVGESRFGDGFPFPRKMMAIILSRMMSKSRLCDYEAELGKIAYASITRRAVAQIIDLVIVGGPAVLIGLFFFFSFWDMENLLFSGPSDFFAGFGLFALSFLWIICCYFIFSFLEGAYGRTPGKWATGIRVLGADLKPCGIGRALLRNLLKVADGFFNFMVGIMLVALTQNWQRVGDMAARTVVVRAEPITNHCRKE
jgi:uncharacterized RDD family membrane protein YckC